MKAILATCVVFLGCALSPDAAAQEAPLSPNAEAAIGAATNDTMADMLEAHEGHMVFARNILEQKAKADERFARRFAAIVEKHDKNQYGA